MEEWHGTGYHGTDCVSAESICEDQCFSISRGNTHWLGDGVYFFVDIHDATWWGQSSKKKNKEPAILKAEIYGKCILNFVSSYMDQSQMDEMLKVVEEKIKKHRKPETISKSGLAIALILKKRPNIDVVIAAFDENRRFKYGVHKNKKDIIYRLQVQICVKKSSCISNICKYEEVG